jgi:hypothetical protein
MTDERSRIVSSGRVENRIIALNPRRKARET